MLVLLLQGHPWISNLEALVLQLGISRYHSSFLYKFGTSSTRMGAISHVCLHFPSAKNQAKGLQIVHERLLVILFPKKH